jgi:glutamate-5-semialdehyde dehydrogenase
MSLAEAETLTEKRTDIGAEMRAVGRAARVAARRLSRATTAEKNKALLAMAAAIRENAEAILADNASEVAAAKEAKLAGSFLDRLKLTPERIEAMAKGIEEIAALPDPVGAVLAAWDRPNGLHIERVRTPLGVIGIIYESRPNVTADAGALCLKAGNAAILRGGSDSFRSSAAIHACLVAGLKAAGLPEEAIQFVPTRDRAAVGLMLTGLEGNIDVIVPRGGKSLVARVQMEARVPVFAHLEGINHVYIDREADLEMAKSIVVNAKMRRTGVCGAAETLLIDAKVAERYLKPLIEALQQAGCRVRGDERSRNVVPGVTPAVESDWSTEYLDAIIAVKVVDGVKEAIDHIERYGSHHTDAIVTNDKRTAQRFMAEVDSAIVLHNASTQFADGGEFGMGAEIGIATGRMHARGPVGVEQLTSFKYRVSGNGQIRP